MLAEVIQMFFDESPGHLATLQQALAAGDAAELGRTAHALKSASFNVGAMALGELCRQLERQAKSGVLTGAAGSVADVEQMLRGFKPLLQAEMGVNA